MGSHLRALSESFQMNTNMQGSPLIGAIGANAPRFSNLHLEYVSLGARIAPRLPTLGIKKVSAWFPGGCGVAGQVNFRGSLPRRASYILELMSVVPKMPSQFWWYICDESIRRKSCSEAYPQLCFKYSWIHDSWSTSKNKRPRHQYCFEYEKAYMFIWSIIYEIRFPLFTEMSGNENIFTTFLIKVWDN